MIRLRPSYRINILYSLLHMESLVKCLSLSHQPTQTKPLAIHRLGGSMRPRLLLLRLGARQHAELLAAQKCHEGKPLEGAA